MLGAGHSAESVEMSREHGQGIGKEDRIETAALGAARQGPIMLDIEAAASMGVGMTPTGQVMPGRHQERT